MTKEEALQIQRQLYELANEVRKKRESDWQALNQFLDLDKTDLFNDAKNYDKASKRLNNKFNSLLVDQSSSIPYEIDIAIAITLAAGLPNHSGFYVGKEEVRTIVAKSMDALGYISADFLPDECFEITNQGLSTDMQHLLVLSLVGALKYLLPHQARNAKPNQISALRTLDELIESKPDFPAFAALRNCIQMRTICDGLNAVQKEQAQYVRFFDHEPLDITDFYQIPRFETVGRATAEILRCDWNFGIRSLVIGKTGSGKSLLTQAIVRTCMEPAQDRSDAYEAYAKQLGLDQNHYLPLILHCADLPEHEDLRPLDLIETAVEQLVQQTRLTTNADRLAHWHAFKSEIMAYYKRHARRMALLFIVEDLSVLSGSRYAAFMDNLQEMLKGDYGCMHVLITSQYLPASQLNRLDGFLRVDLSPLTDAMESQLTALAALGVCRGDAAVYRDLVERNRFFQRFVDTPRHLVKLLYADCQDCMGLDKLVMDTIEEYLGRCTCTQIDAEACRELLTWLAVSIAENRGSSRAFYGRRRVRCNAIPTNIVDSGVQADLQNGMNIWQYILNHNVLLCPGSGINSYTFINPLFYHSLVVDHYISLLEQPEATHWLERFNRLSSDDFSVVSVMLLGRVCRYGQTEERSIPRGQMLLMLQAMVGYIMSRVKPGEMYDCLLALDDILFNDCLRENFLSLYPASFWEMLERVYKVCYDLYPQLSDADERLDRLHVPRM